MKHCLIISTNALGDTYLSMSALPALKDMSVDLITTAGFESYTKHFNLNKVFLLREKNFWNIIDTGTELLDNQYDYVFSFFPGRINTFFFNISKSFIKSGFVNYLRMPEWHSSKSKLTLRGIKKINYYWTPENNYLDRIYYPLYFAGIKTAYPSKLEFGNFYSDIVSKKFIICNFSSRSKSRCLSENSIFIILEKLLNIYNGKLFLLTDNADIPIKDSNLFFMDYSDSVKILNHIISAEAFIGVDSFPLHIADAYSKKIVGLFSDTNPNSVFQNPSDKVGLKNPDINNIKPEDVVNALKLLNIV